jgi:ferredoxin/truncated hemoglobin YjbI
MTTTTVALEGTALEVRPNESLLDACLRSAVQLPFSCKSGICQTCLLHCTQGVIPTAAQRGLSDTQRNQGLLLACQCHPAGHMTLTQPGSGDRVAPCIARAEDTAQGPDDSESPGTSASRPEVEAPEPDPGLWSELGGSLARAVLEDFYAQVYADPQLAPFFVHVTIDRAIDKQYSFMRQLMTGERVYFGDRPRNAHHWMVISQDLFDYRQQLMVTTLQAHGLSPLQIARWTRLEQHYRLDIVKDNATPRQLDGVDLPLDGYASEQLSEATLCDHCGAEIDAGTQVLYHVRLGHVSCRACAKTQPHQSCDDELDHAQRA